MLRKQCPARAVGVSHGLNLVEKARLGFPRLFMKSSCTVWEPNNSSGIH